LYEIKTLNAISEVINEQLDAEKYRISPEAQNPSGIIVRSADCHEMVFGEALLAIARAGAGVNNIPLERCSQEGIVVFNTPGANANAVTELVLATMFMSTRNVVAGIEWCKTLRGQGADIPALVEKGKGKFVGIEVRGKRMGVIGLGAIGVTVANDSHAIGMKVSGYDPFISVENAWGLSRAENSRIRRP
jgi:D-3-phosphoglycerate dehydrogenase